MAITTAIALGQDPFSLRNGLARHPHGGSGAFGKVNFYRSRPEFHAFQPHRNPLGLKKAADENRFGWIVGDVNADPVTHEIQRPS